MTELGRSSDEASTVRPHLLAEEPNVGMMVVALRRLKKWQRGQLVEIRTLGNNKRISLVGAMHTFHTLHIIAIDLAFSNCQVM